jgi:hypothetical protein
MKKFIYITLIMLVSVIESNAQVIKIKVDTIHSFNHNAFITTDMAMKSNNYTITLSFITSTTYTIDYDKMVMTSKDFNGVKKTFNIINKLDCNCVCNFTFEAVNNGITDIVYVIVDKSSDDNKKYITYFRWNSFDEKGLSKTFGWFNGNTTIL